jgi:hypothetical protein
LSRLTKVIYKNSDGHENSFFSQVSPPLSLPTPPGPADAAADTAGAAAYDGDDEIQIWKCNNNDFLP